jgi:hypothetical protein
MKIIEYSHRAVKTEVEVRRSITRPGFGLRLPPAFRLNVPPVP